MIRAIFHKKNTHCWGLCYFSLMMVLYIFNGWFVWTRADRMSELIIIDNSLANAVVDDWTKDAFTEMIVTDWRECPPDYPEPVFVRPFQGTRFGCDCLNVGSEWIDNSYSVAFDRACTINETLAFCHNSQPLDPIDQSLFGGKQVCGRRSSNSFMDAQRPTASGDCPSGTQVCNSAMSQENKLCVRDLSTCPITFVNFAANAALADYPASVYTRL